MMCSIKYLTVFAGVALCRRRSHGPRITVLDQDIREHCQRIGHHERGGPKDCRSRRPECLSHPSGLRELSIDKNGGLQMNAVVAPPVSPLRPTSEQNPGPPPPLDQFKAPDIAYSLTVIEGERYAEITQVDYVAHLSGAISKHIESATKVNNRLVNWVRKKILRSVGYFS